MKDIFLVGLGGFFGAITRYLVVIQSKNIDIFTPHFKTAIINITGSFLMGVLLFLGPYKLNSSFLLFLIPGFLGGFTTYSAFSAETFSLIKNGQNALALIYLFLTLVGGLLGVSFGFYLSKKFFF